MGQADWDLLAKRRWCRTCSRPFAEGGAPTTPTTASIIGAIQAQEVVKRCMAWEASPAAAFSLRGCTITPTQWHTPSTRTARGMAHPHPSKRMPAVGSATPLRKMSRAAATTLGPLDALDLSREIVTALECPACRTPRPVHRPVELIRPEEVPCPSCGREAVPQFCHSLAENSPLLELTPRQIGLPPWDILSASPIGQQTLGLELSADHPADLADAANE